MCFFESMHVEGDERLHDDAGTTSAGVAGTQVDTGGKTGNGGRRPAGPTRRQARLRF
jgi:hypothetical protein